MISKNGHEVVVGSVVEGGEGEDHDIGRVTQVTGNRVRVAWNSGVSTWDETQCLTVMGESR